MIPAVLLWPLVAGLLLCAILGVRPGRRAAAGWSALLIAGQAALLTLYRSGPVVTYHHLRPDLEDPLQRAALGLLALQTLAVVVELARRRGQVASFLATHLASWRGALALTVLVLASAKVARPGQAFALELVGATALHLTALGNLALAAGALSPAALEDLERVGARWLGPRGDGASEPGGVDRFALAVAAWTLVATALLAWFVYERHPHVPDEVVYLLHAEYLAAGKLSMAVPPVPAAFDVDLMLRAGERWYCPVPLGWPLALAVGAFCGAPWLVNPVLSALGVLAAYLFLRELTSRRGARLAILVLAVTPWFLFLGMSFMTHAWGNACALLAALGVARARRTGSLAWAWGAGASLGMASLIRPLDGLVLALLLGLWAVGLGGARLRPGAILGLVLGALLVGGATLPYNARMTGSAGQFPIMEYSDVHYEPGSNDLGFGPEKGAGMDWRGLDPWPGHDPLQAVVNHQFNTFGLDAELFGWVTGSLWLLLLACVWRVRPREDRLMLAVIGATVLASSFYYFAGGPDFGPRYWYAVLIPCLWLTLSGLRGLEQRSAPGRGTFALALLCTAALVTFVPWRAHDKYPDYRGMQPGVRELAQRHGFGTSLVLVRGERHPDYASAAVYNPVEWDAAAPIYAWDREDLVRLEVLEAYAERPVWVIDGPSVTGAGFELVEGPISAAEMIARTREDLAR